MNSIDVIVNGCKRCGDKDALCDKCRYKNDIKDLRNKIDTLLKEVNGLKDLIAPNSKLIDD